ncbi:ABC transporter ATP-binding protein [Brevibacillus reuszeri]|uniref:Carnitine transport ATP-binding protein OpuCA n=1 Tax=Brevibacillus reuszeri TaxID=54915 RepID=A0A0K9YLZ6_9BACL|nr:ABC transporter ATP-binding protein [Brevibacillus reuszeri]KNB69215.1 ABC transporter ATP-binding protein [Brevibacillus reuszeri]MED1860151.1 ABC transporter ATP-binding protein [Brevibacillus reuszeri]GED71652.1 ABC transporter ATP-binding protein [Brevibacillus reuszeri]
MSYVQIDRLSKRFKETAVLNKVSLSIEKGELITLLGPSGCGKSTLLRCIAGLTDVEDGGKIVVGETDITQLSPKDREVGMVFQSYALFPNMNVYGNICFGLKMKGVKKEEYKERVERIIDLVDLRGRENSYPHQLSGGQQQRVALARSLVVEPKILLLDEPLSALDAKIRKSLQTEIRRIQQELSITTVFVTHDQEEALTVSDRIFVMDHGNIVQIGTPEEIYAHPASEFVARFIGNYNVMKRAEMTQLVGEITMAGEAFAIRPEVISLAPLGNDASTQSKNGWSVESVVRSMTLKGNVIRYEVEAKHQKMQVDVLNTSDNHWIRVGTTVFMQIPAEECIPLQ